MFKVSLTCEYHCDAVFVAFLDGVFVSDGSAGLDDSGDACFVSGVNTVVKREESIGCENGAFCLVACVLDSEFESSYTVCLAGAYADGSFILDEDDTVGLGMLNDLHTEAEVAHLFFGGSSCAYL